MDESWGFTPMTWETSFLGNNKNRMISEDFSFPPSRGGTLEIRILFPTSTGESQQGQRQATNVRNPTSPGSNMIQGWWWMGPPTECHGYSILFNDIRLNHHWIVVPSSHRAASMELRLRWSCGSDWDGTIERFRYELNCQVPWIISFPGRNSVEMTPLNRL